MEASVKYKNTYYDKFPKDYFDEYELFYKHLLPDRLEFIHWKEFRHLKIKPRFLKRQDVKQSIKNKVKKRDGKCVMCCSTENLSVDHIIPYSVSFDNTLFNLVAMCVECNERKGNKTIDNIIELYRKNILNIKT